MYSIKISKKSQIKNVLIIHFYNSKYKLKFIYYAIYLFCYFPIISQKYLKFLLKF